MEKTQTRNYAFIDDQNLYVGIKKSGWLVDYRKLRKYLAEKYKVEKAFIFLGYIAQNHKMYDQLKKYGYILVFKPIVKDKNGKIKGNVDVELTIHVLTKIQEYDGAFILSGDGDFYSLYKYLIKHQKLLHIGIPNRREYSWLLRKFRDFFIFLQNLENKLKM